MPVPFKVKAIYEYKSDEPDDLSFENGQIITVTEEEDDDWYTGEFTNAVGQTVEGIFPRNFVEKYEPVVPSRPARASRRPPQAEATPAGPVSVATAAAPQEEAAPAPAAPPSAAHEPSKDAEIYPPRELIQPPPAPVPAPAKAQEPVIEEQSAAAAPPQSRAEQSAKKAPPPVAEKPSSNSFKDRIAAFNKPAAAPVAPFKPSSSATGSSSFIKKPFVAPPPSRNAYVPPPREIPPPKVYRREEDEAERASIDEQPQAAPPLVISAATTNDDEDQPKPTSLKERIALLQQQQAEQAQRQADSARKKDKPKRPAKPARADSTDADAPPGGEHPSQPDADMPPPRHSTDDDPAEPHTAIPRSSLDDAAVITTPSLPSRELVSDTNDADDSGAADTEDQHDLSAEEERPKAALLPPRQASAAAMEDAEEDDDDTEEEEDPEVKRKRELRERMAKMSGGMGMMGMFGGGMPAARKAKTPREEKPPAEQPVEEDAPRAPPVPIMALPGMSNLKSAPQADPDDESDHDDTAQPTPMESQTEVDEALTDYVSPKPPSRQSTARSLAMSPTERAPPPLPSVARPEPPQSPGARPVPPPPPPTKHAGELPLAQDFEEDDDENDLRAPAPPVPGSRPAQATSPTVPRAAPPPLPAQEAGQAPRGAPPIPMSPTSPTTRAPPPPPPGPPSRKGTFDSTRSRHLDDSEDEVTEYDGDYDTDIASGVKHKAALKSHNRESSIDEGRLSDDATETVTSPQTRAPPPIPTAAPRDGPPPPPPPHAVPVSRPSTDLPRAAPPPVPPTQTQDAEDEYDPYRYSGTQAGLPAMIATIRRPTDMSETSDLYDAPPQMAHDSPVNPADRAPPPPPSMDRAAPPPPPPTQDASSMSGALSMPERPKQSGELGRSNTMSRRSADAPRSSHEQAFIASDLDLAPASQWYTRENTPPPSLQGRNDVLWEVESSTSTKRGGRTTITRDVYVLHQDYSQTIINVVYDPADPQQAIFEQSHERPPMPPRKDQLENASETFGAQISKTAEKAAGSSVGEGSAAEFVSSLIRPLNSALMPVGTRAYGALVYMNLANASTQQFDEIRPGDVMTFRNAKFSGHKGSLHQKYTQDVGYHVAVVIDWDGTKKKIRVWEQGNQEKGKKAKVRDESYRVIDLKSGEVRVWRVMPRSYVKWGTS